MICINQALGSGVILNTETFLLKGEIMNLGDEMRGKRMDMMQNMTPQMLEYPLQKDKAAAEAQRK